jgi:hypothetical protein
MTDLHPKADDRQGDTEYLEVTQSGHCVHSVHPRIDGLSGTVIIRHG